MIEREREGKQIQRYLFFIIFVSSIDLILLCERLRAYPSPCELKLCPVMLCLDLVRCAFLSFFFSVATRNPDYVHKNRLATRRNPKHLSNILS